MPFVLRIFTNIHITLSPAVESQPIHFSLDHLPFILTNKLLSLQVLINSIPIHFAIFPFPAISCSADKSINAHSMLFVSLPLSLVELAIHSLECSNTMSFIFHKFTIIN